MNIDKYLDKIRKLHEFLIDYIDAEDDIELRYQFLIKFLIDNQFQNNSYDLKLVLHLLCSISNNHYRHTYFFNKIEKILHFFQKDIKKYFSNFEIFNIFKSNKRILLFLIERKIIYIDNNIYYQISNYKYSEAEYLQYFSNEINKFLAKTESNDITENFEEKRKIGENDDYVCTLIRKDMVEEFIYYVNKTNLPLSSVIKHSIFETNSFLIKNKDTKLIEYSAFFGSIQIFQYLFMNNIELTPSLWLYAIHGRNAELIHMLEDNHVKFQNNFSINCLYESIKCHHNELVSYFQDNYADNGKNIFQNAFLKGLQYYNFSLFQDYYIKKIILYELCKYDYFILVDFLLNNNDININDCIIE